MNGTSGIIKSIHLRNAKNISEDTGIHHVDFNKDEDYIIVELDDISMMHCVVCYRIKSLLLQGKVTSHTI